MDTYEFKKFSAVSSIFAGLLGLLYSFSFFVLDNSQPYLASIVTASCLLVTGILLSVVFVRLYEEFKKTNQSFVLWIFLLSLLAAAGMIIHGGYDLANAINAPSPNLLAEANLPNQVDPRGLLVFGLSGLALFGWAWLFRHSNYPQGISRLGYILAIAYSFTFVSRLIWVDVETLIVGIPLVLSGAIVGPWWYIWVGKYLWPTN